MSSYKNDKKFDSIFLQSLKALTLDKTLLSPQPQETQNLKEETKIEREIIKAISSGKYESLKPNSGQAITIGENYVCVSFHEELESDCRVWEWHGHVVSYSEENGYTQEYVYGSYFERLMIEKWKAFDDNECDYQEESEFGPREFIGRLHLNGW